jgi:hypothetical protein
MTAREILARTFSNGAHSLVLSRPALPNLKLE